MTVSAFDIKKVRELVISESNSARYDKIEEECKKQVKEFLEEYNIDNLKNYQEKHCSKKYFYPKILKLNL